MESGFAPRGIYSIPGFRGSFAFRARFLLLLRSSLGRLVILILAESVFFSFRSRKRMKHERATSDYERQNSRQQHAEAAGNGDASRRHVLGPRSGGTTGAHGRPGRSGSIVYRYGSYQLSYTYRAAFSHTSLPHSTPPPRL